MYLISDINIYIVGGGKLFSAGSYLFVVLTKRLAMLLIRYQSPKHPGAAYDRTVK